MNLSSRSRHLLALLAAAGAGVLFIACEPAPRPAPKVEAVYRDPTIEVTGAGQALTQLTRDDTNEVNPVLSPDGEILAYVKIGKDQYGNSTNAVIAATNANSASGETLYSGSNYSSWYPHWMPGDQGLMMINNSTGKWAVVRTLDNSPGSAVRVIVPGEVAEDIDFAQISPDGKRVYFEAKMAGSRRIAYMNVDGTGLTVLGEGRQPALSPDGSQIAFCRIVNDWYQIFLMDAENGGNLTQLTKSGSDVKEFANVPSWSPDGKWIAFTSNKGTNTLEDAQVNWTRNLYLMTNKGTKLTPVTSGAGKCDWTHWGSDNRIYFAYQETASMDSDIWRVSINDAVLSDN